MSWGHLQALLWAPQCIDECTFYPGTTTGTWLVCIQLGVLRSVFALLSANLRIKLISPFYNHAASLSHAIFSINSTFSISISFTSVSLRLSKMQHHRPLEKCSHKRMCSKSLHVDMSSPKGIAADADLEWLRCINYFCLIILQMCFAFLIQFVLLFSQFFNLTSFISTDVSQVF